MEHIVEKGKSTLLSSICHIRPLSWSSSKYPRHPSRVNRKSNYSISLQLQLITAKLAAVGVSPPETPLSSLHTA